MLLKLVDKYHCDWKKISFEMKNRNIRQCKERYYHYLSPNIKSDIWTPDEDIILLKMIDQHGRKWKYFENIFSGRTEINIRNRYYVLSRKFKSPPVTLIELYSNLQMNQNIQEENQNDNKKDKLNHNQKENENEFISQNNDIRVEPNLDDDLFFDYNDDTIQNDSDFLYENSMNEFFIDSAFY